MVKVWDVLRDKAIATQKRRIECCERNGIGDSTIKEKAILKKMERAKELRKLK